MWFDALFERHVRPMGQPAFLKAVRALSARYVERRQTIGVRSPIDSAGKRAAFAAFFGPLHFLTTRELVRALGLDQAAIGRIVDLGCGTGPAGAAWACSLAPRPTLSGVDANRWAIDEAHWNWRALGLVGRARRGDLLDECARLLDRPRRSAARTGIVLGWTVNELDAAARRSLLPRVIELAERGSPVLVVEPLARRAVPWWDDWARSFHAAGGQAREWRLDVVLPARLADLDRAAGFQRDALTARSLSVLPPDVGAGLASSQLQS